jgi:formylmethanofuran dehydrogenase subunit B
METEYSDVACTLCGCVCDDLTIRVRDGQVVAADRACSIAAPWFSEQKSAEINAASIHGKPASIETAVQHSAEILRNSHAPLIYGLSRSSTPGQRAAVRLADQLGATIDTTASTCHAPSIIALQQVGESTCSLGEIKNRSDLVVYWGSNPLVSHPRHVERIVDAPGMFIPGGRTDRQLIVVDCQPTETSALADTFIQVEAGRDLELICALRLLLQGESIEHQSIAGLDRAQIEQFAAQLKNCNYGAIFFGLGVTRTVAPHATVEAILRLATDLNQHTRFVVRRMRVPGDVAGADSVLCWQTGFPFSVNLARGYPRYNPGEYTAENLLARGEVDAVVLVGSEGIAKLSSAARQRLATLPVIALDYPGEQYVNSQSHRTATVQFTTSIYGVHQPGTAYRMDEIPIPLRAFLPATLPSDEQILQQIARSIAE